MTSQDQYAPQAGKLTLSLQTLKDLSVPPSSADLLKAGYRAKSGTA